MKRNKGKCKVLKNKTNEPSTLQLLGLGSSLAEGGWRSWRWFFCPWRRAQGTSCHSIPALRGRRKEDRVFLFTRAHMEKTNSNGYKFQGERFHVNIRKKLFTARTIMNWNKLPRDMVESPWLEVFNMWLDRASDNLIWVPFPMEE